MTVAEAIIGVLGAGILGMLCFFFQSIKSDLRALGTRLDHYDTIMVDVLARLTKIETVQEEHGRRLTRIEATLEEHGRRLTRIEATLEEHGRRLAQMTGHGERIAALEGATGAG